MARNEARQIAVYLAGPIDDVNFATAYDWRHKLSEDYPAVLFFTPLGPWLNANPRNAHIVDHGNRHMIHTCHGLFANLADDGYGFGTIREIEFAARNGQPVVVVTDGRINEDTLMAHDLMVHSTIHEGMTALLDKIGTGLRREQMMSPFGAIQLIAPRDMDEPEDDPDSP